MFRNETNYVLTNGVLLDGTEKMTPQTGRDIYIEGGRIGAVADAAARRGLSICTFICPPPASRRKRRATRRSS